MIQINCLLLKADEQFENDNIGSRSKDFLDIPMFQETLGAFVSAFLTDM